MLAELVRGTESAGDPIRCDTGNREVSNHVITREQSFRIENLKINL